MIQEDLHRFIAQCKLGVLSTLADTGAPQSALVGIAVTPNLEIVFDTVKTSRKYPNLIARNRCSFVIGGQVSKRCNTKARLQNFMGRSCNAAKWCTSKHGPIVELTSRGLKSCIS